MQESWDDLRYVLALARAGRLDGAGGLLDVDPSTVFRRLKACETRLDARLFDRRGGVYRATAEGEAVIAQAEAMEEAALAMQRRLAGGDVRLSGTLRITMEGEIDGETLIGAWGAWQAGFAPDWLPAAGVQSMDAGMGDHDDDDDDD